MAATAHPSTLRVSKSKATTLLAAPVRRGVTMVWLAVGLIALHVLDDTLLQPNPGTSAGDHLAGALVPLAMLVAVAFLYPRLRAGGRALAAILVGLAGIFGGVEAVHYAREAGALSGDDYTGLLSLLAGLALLGAGGVSLWRSRRRDDHLWWRYGRRLLLLVSALVVAFAVLFPVAIAYVVTHAARGHVPPDVLGIAHEDVQFTTADGLLLKGWYIPSRNGAAVIAFPGRASTQERARLLASHGYGVLLFDRRGEGESEGDPNLFGWQGERDIHAAVAFLEARPDVVRGQIGGIGLSVGGEMMIEAAAESNDLRAIVTEGASSRSVRDELANPGGGWPEIMGNSVATLATAVFSGDLPPATLRSLVPQISGAVFFVYGERGQPAERPANRAFYAAAHGEKEIWEVPGSGHIGGVEAEPQEYERRVVGFFDRTLLDGTRP